MALLVKPPQSLGFFSPATLIATWFGAGLLRPASGTWGSLAALPFAWALTSFGGHGLLFLGTVTIFAAGTWAADIYEKAGSDKDPGSVVADEVAGVWMTLLFVPQEIFWYAIAFAAFRFFDVLKIWPISWLDQNVKGGFGIMIDDVLAALFAGALCLILMIYI
jgi:phosphatidylglycerophosphatase A